MSSVVQIARNHCRTREAIKKSGKKTRCTAHTAHTRVVKRRRCRIRSLPIGNGSCEMQSTWDIVPELVFRGELVCAAAACLVNFHHRLLLQCNIINRWWKLLLDNSSSDECAREMRKMLFSKSTQAKDQVELGSPSCFLCLADDDWWQVQLFILASVPTALSLLQRSNGHKSRFELLWCEFCGCSRKLQIALGSGSASSVWKLL